MPDVNPLTNAEVCIHICTYTHVHTCTYTYIHTCTNMYMCTHMHKEGTGMPDVDPLANAEVFATFDKADVT